MDQQRLKDLVLARASYETLLEFALGLKNGGMSQRDLYDLFQSVFDLDEVQNGFQDVLDEIMCYIWGFKLIYPDGGMFKKEME